MFAGKDIENRSWTPPDRLVGQRIAIHAGQNPGHAEALKEIRRDHRLPNVLPRGLILGTVLLKGYVDDERHCSVGLTAAEVRRATKSKWAQGPCLWVLDDPRPFGKPVPCSGQLRLWTVPS